MLHILASSAAHFLFSTAVVAQDSRVQRGGPLEGRQRTLRERARPAHHRPVRQGAFVLYFLCVRGVLALRLHPPPSCSLSCCMKGSLSFRYLRSFRGLREPVKHGLDPSPVRQRHIQQVTPSQPPKHWNCCAQQRSGMAYPSSGPTLSSSTKSLKRRMSAD
jgi:hypothetical protein